MKYCYLFLNICMNFFDFPFIESIFEAFSILIQNSLQCLRDISNVLVNVAVCYVALKINVLNLLNYVLESSN